MIHEMNACFFTVHQYICSVVRENLDNASGSEEKDQKKMHEKFSPAQ